MADYLPFGKIANEDNSSLKLFSRFPGQWLDAVSDNKCNWIGREVS
jgi:hypothetical protein